MKIRMMFSALALTAGLLVAGCATALMEDTPWDEIFDDGPSSRLGTPTDRPEQEGSPSRTVRGHTAWKDIFDKGPFRLGKVADGPGQARSPSEMASEHTAWEEVFDDGPSFRLGTLSDRRE